MGVDNSMTSQTFDLGKTNNKNTEKSKVLSRKGHPTKELRDSNQPLCAQKVQKAKTLANNQIVDEAKVKRLQKLIDNEKYQVDASTVADRLVDSHLRLPK